MAKLYFRYGAMNCGKSTALLQVDYNYRERNMKTVIIKPATDTKGSDWVVSRLGVERRTDILATGNDVKVHPFCDGLQRPPRQLSVDPLGRHFLPSNKTGESPILQRVSIGLQPDRVGKRRHERISVSVFPCAARTC